jgi:hypothetical protein
MGRAVAGASAVVSSDEPAFFFVVAMVSWNLPRGVGIPQNAGNGAS